MGQKLRANSVVMNDLQDLVGQWWFVGGSDNDNDGHQVISSCSSFPKGDDPDDSD